jgi:hypothetical protein
MAGRNCVGICAPFYETVHENGSLDACHVVCLELSRVF